MARVLSVLAFSILLMAAPGSAAPGQSGPSPSEAARAADLSKQGWRILNSDSRFGSWPALSPDDVPYYEYVCDRPEAALDYFRRAAALDPDLAQAWRGWGRALEDLGLCPRNGDKRTWAQTMGLEPYKINPENFYPLPYRTPTEESLIAAEEKFRQAVEASPQDYQVWLNLGFNQMNLASHQAEDQAERRRLLAEGLAATQKALDLNPKDVLAWGRWRQLLLRAARQEPDPARWPALLDLARATVDRQVDLWPETGSLEEYGHLGQLWPNNAASAIFEAFHDFYGSAMFEKDPDKVRALIQAALDLKDLEIGLRGVSPEDARDIGDLHLLRARTLADDRQWQQALSQAEEALDRYLNEIENRGGLTPVYLCWSSAARREDNPARRLVLVEKALKIVGENNGYAELGSPDKTSLDRYPPPIRELAAKGSFLLELAVLLPDCPRRRELIREAESDLEKALSLAGTEQKADLWQRWARALFALAQKEEDEEKIDRLLKQVDEKFQLASESSSDPARVWDNWGDALAYSFRRKGLDRQISVVKNALEKYQRADAYVHLGGFRLDSRGDLYYRLGWLYQKKSFTGWPWYRKTLDQYVLDMEAEERGKWPSRVAGEQTFKMGLMLSGLVDQHPAQGRNNVRRSMHIFRRFFNTLPADSEYWNRRGSPWPSWDPQSEEKHLKQTFQHDLTRTIAEKMLEIRKVDPDKISSWRLAGLAGLHRHLAWSGMLTPEYRRLYHRRAENYLRRALIGSEYGPFTAEKRRGLLTDQAGTLAELGLALAEGTLLDKTDGAGGLQEAEELWRQAGELLPGSDRYARARWAARLGDRESLIKNLRHSRGEMSRGFFPSLEEALDDPAFAAYKDADWFRQTWYGFNPGGE